MAIKDFISLLGMSAVFRLQDASPQPISLMQLSCRAGGNFEPLSLFSCFPMSSN